MGAGPAAVFDGRSTAPHGSDDARGPSGSGRPECRSRAQLGGSATPRGGRAGSRGSPTSAGRPHRSAERSGPRSGRRRGSRPARPWATATSPRGRLGCPGGRGDGASASRDGGDRCDSGNAASIDREPRLMAGGIVGDPVLGHARRVDDHDGRARTRSPRGSSSRSGSGARARVRRRTHRRSRRSPGTSRDFSAACMAALPASITRRSIWARWRPGSRTDTRRPRSGPSSGRRTPDRSSIARCRTMPASAGRPGLPRRRGFDRDSATSIDAPFMASRLLPRGWPARLRRG